MIAALLIGLGIILTSVIGSVAGIAFRKISHRTNDIFLGFASGVMLAAAFIGLLPSAFEYQSFFTLPIGVIGVIVGAVFISLIDKFVPHTHIESIEGAMDGGKGSSGTINRTMLLVIAIAIHNIPEGLATGISLSQGISSNGLLIGISMAVQKIPEGLIVAIPLLASGMKRKNVFFFSVIVAFMMLPGLLFGIFLGQLPEAVIKFFTAFTFGAIVYVISDEVIPESHQHGFHKQATFGIIVGLLLVVALQGLLG